MQPKYLLPSFFVLFFVLSGCSYQADGNRKSYYEDNGESSLEYELPPKTNLQINYFEASDLKTDVVVLGIVCSAHEYSADISKRLKASLSAMDVDGVLNSSEAADLKVSVSSNEGRLKCVQSGALSGQCQAEFTLEVEISDGTGKTENVIINEKALHSTIGCGGAAKALRIASAESLSSLLSKVSAYSN